MQSLIDQIKNSQNTEEIRNKAIEAIENYYNALQSTQRADDLENQILFFFNDRHFEDNVLTYKSICVALLKALTQPKIAEKVREEMGEGLFDQLPNMLERLFDFSESMGYENYEVAFLLYRLKNEMENYSEKELQRMALEYGIKAKGVVRRREIEAILGM